MTAAGGQTYCYDNNGNQTRRNATTCPNTGGDAFTWDYENRLTQAVIGGTTSNYTYDGDGVRVKEAGWRCNHGVLSRHQ